MTTRIVFVAGLLVLAGIAPACGSSNATPAPSTDGTEGGRCRQASICNAGLVCLLNTCSKQVPSGFAGTNGAGGAATGLGGASSTGGTGTTASHGGASSTGGSGAASGHGGQGTGAGGMAPSCVAASHSCTAESDCCSGLHCERGTCEACTAQYPKFCPQSTVAESTCWASDVNCDTVTTCSGALKACTGTVTVPDCTTGKCECPDANYPVYCAAKGSIPEDCFSPGAICSTIKDCGGNLKSCSSASDEVNCTTDTCEPITGGTGGSGGVCQPGSVDCDDMSSSACKCGQYCFQGCATCSFRCGWSCSTDADCVQESGGLYKHCTTFSLENRCSP